MLLSFFWPTYSILTHHLFLSRARLVLVLVLLGRRRWPARLQHLFEHLVADTAYCVVLRDGNVSQLVVVTQVGSVGVPMLVG